MITLVTSSDKEYKSTKRIKRGEEQLASPFRELADWISRRWEVSVLNVAYDGRCELHAPRIQVILEYGRELQQFRAGSNFDPAKQLEIKSKFMELAGNESVVCENLSDLFVVFSAFAPIAIEEAVGRLSEQDVNSMKRYIQNPDLWDVLRCFRQIVFLFYTDSQVAKYIKSGKLPEYRELCYKLLKPYDEFGYLVEGDLQVSFDSKQNFDKNYQGNWFNYFR